MRLQENIARILLVTILILIPSGILGYQYILASKNTEHRIINILAANPEEGGFDPEIIQIAAKETVTLVIHSPDVMHGFAIGPGINLDLGELSPGETMRYDIRIDQPGRYTLYCTVWCSPNHWRMRMTIEVFDPAYPENNVQAGGQDPAILRIAELGIDIDATHLADFTPEATPSSVRGASLSDAHSDLISASSSPNEFPQWISPSEVAYQFVGAGIPEQDTWDMIAYLWTVELSRTEIEKAETLYIQNCVGCHGETGAGDGPGAIYINDQGFHGDESAASFINRESMLGGTTAIYYAKLRRGGMGTGMPGFGNILSREDTWLLAEYIWTFVFSP